MSPPRPPQVCATGPGAVCFLGVPACVVQGMQVQSWISGRRNGVLYFVCIDLSEWLHEYSSCFLLTLFYKNQNGKEKSL